MGSVAFGLLPLVSIVLAVALDVLCLRDLLLADRVRRLPKWAWAIVICVFSALGGIAYLAFGRTR